MFPVISLILAVITYFLARKMGAKKGVAALAALGVGALAYNTVDPANAHSMFFNDNKSAKIKPEDAAAMSDDTEGASIHDTGGTGEGVTTALAGLGTTALQEVGSTARSWGPTGTAAVIATPAAVSWFKKNPLLVALIGIGVIIALKD